MELERFLIKLWRTLPRGQCVLFSRFVTVLGGFLPLLAGTVSWLLTVRRVAFFIVVIPLVTLPTLIVLGQ